MTPEELQALIASLAPSMSGAGPPPVPPVRYASPRPVPEQAAPAPRPMSLWDRLIGVPEGLDPESGRAARRGGLSAMAEAFYNAPRGRGIALAPALSAGMEGATAGAEQFMARRLAQATQARQQDFYAKYATANLRDPAVLEEMFLSAAATPGMEKTASALSEVVKTLRGGGANLYHGSAINPATGKLEDYEVGPGGKPRFYGAENVNPQPNIQEQRDFQRANQLSDDYRADVKPWQVPYASMKRAMASAPQAKTGNTAAQIQMLYAFINTLDNSVVREGEAHMFMNAAPVLEKARAYLNKYALNKGAVMPPGLVEEVENILTLVNESFEARFDSLRRHYQSLGKQWSVDPGTFIDVPGMYKADGSVKSTQPAPASGSLDDFVKKGGK